MQNKITKESLKNAPSNQEHSTGKTTIKRVTSQQLALLCKQTEAKEWIEAVLKEQIDEDLSISLKNGVILCRLIKEIDPGCNITVPQVPKIVFKMMENVSKYLKAAANYGVTVLFTPPDLVNSENMMAVILSIHDLAEVAEKKGFPIHLEKTPGVSDLISTTDIVQKLATSVVVEDKFALISEDHRRPRLPPSNYPNSDKPTSVATNEVASAIDAEKNTYAKQNEESQESKKKKKKKKDKKRKSVDEEIDINDLPPTYNEATQALHTTEVSEHFLTQPNEEAENYKKSKKKERHHRKSISSLEGISPFVSNIEEDSASHKKKDESKSKNRLKKVESDYSLANKLIETENFPTYNSNEDNLSGQPEVTNNEKKSRRGSIHSRSRSVSEIDQIDISPSYESSVSSSSFVGTLTPTSSFDENAVKINKARLNVFNEILYTERDYVRDLELIVELFVNPLQKKNILDSASIQAIFSNIEVIIKINKAMLVRLESRNEEILNGKTDWLCGDIFLGVADFFKIYASYCNNQSIATQMLNKAFQQPNFINWWQETKSKTDLHGLTISDYLVKPAQRICRYPLLIRELLKKTPLTHLDYEKLNSALPKMETIATFVNEAKRDAENSRRLLELRDSVQGMEDIVAPSRKLIKEGELMKMSDGQSKPITLILFNDMLIICGKKSSLRGKGWHVAHQFKLALCSISELEESLAKPGFQLNTTEKRFVFICPSLEEKEEWVKAFKKNIDTNLQQTTSPTIQQRQDSPTPMDNSSIASSKDKDNKKKTRSLSLIGKEKEEKEDSPTKEETGGTIGKSSLRSAFARVALKTKEGRKRTGSNSGSLGGDSSDNEIKRLNALLNTIQEELQKERKEKEKLLKENQELKLEVQNLKKIMNNEST